MNDEQYEAERARVQEILNRWIKPLGLKWWSVHIEYFREPIPEEDEAPRSHGHVLPHAVATCSCDWKYLRAILRFDLRSTEAMEPERLEWTVVHELMHIFLNETRAEDSDGDWLDHEERVASQLANAFIWLRESLVNEAASGG